MKVVSNNGTVHKAYPRTKLQRHAGYVIKACDGQWVSRGKIVGKAAWVTCSSKACGGVTPDLTIHQSFKQEGQP